MARSRGHPESWLGDRVSRGVESWRGLQAEEVTCAKAPGQDGALRGIQGPPEAGAEGRGGGDASRGGEKQAPVQEASTSATANRVRRSESRGPNPWAQLEPKGSQGILELRLGER